jgi:PadR family transcriptional regulator, regulatory protein AphA
MGRGNPTEFAILGLLAEGPRSGYDIKKEVEERLSHFWSESYGHIYPMLRRLHDRDLVVKEVERQEGRPDRNVYHITEGGRRALEGWFAEPPAPVRPRNELLLRIFLGRHARPEHLIRDVRAFREGVEESQSRLRAVRDRIEAEAGSHPDRIYWDLVLDYGLTAFEALNEWSRKTEDRLRTLESDDGRTGAPT